MPMPNGGIDFDKDFFVDWPATASAAPGSSRRRGLLVGFLLLSLRRNLAMARHSGPWLFSRAQSGDGVALRRGARAASAQLAHRPCFRSSPSPLGMRQPFSLRLRSSSRLGLVVELNLLGRIFGACPFGLGRLGLFRRAQAPGQDRPADRAMGTRYLVLPDGQRPWRRIDAGAGTPAASACSST